MEEIFHEEHPTYDMESHMGYSSQGGTPLLCWGRQGVEKPPISHIWITSDMLKSQKKDDSSSNIMVWDYRTLGNPHKRKGFSIIPDEYVKPNRPSLYHSNDIFYSDEDGSENNHCGATTNTEGQPCTVDVTCESKKCTDSAFRVPSYNIPLSDHSVKSKNNSYYYNGLVESECIVPLKNTKASNLQEIHNVNAAISTNLKSENNLSHPEDSVNSTDSTKSNSTFKAPASKRQSAKAKRRSKGKNSSTNIRDNLIDSRCTTKILNTAEYVKASSAKKHISSSGSSEEAQGITQHTNTDSVFENKLIIDTATICDKKLYGADISSTAPNSSIASSSSTENGLNEQDGLQNHEVDVADNKYEEPPVEFPYILQKEKNMQNCNEYSKQSKKLQKKQMKLERKAAKPNNSFSTNACFEEHSNKYDDQIRFASSKRKHYNLNLNGFGLNQNSFSQNPASRYEIPEELYRVSSSNYTSEAEESNADFPKLVASQALKFSGSSKPADLPKAPLSLKSAAKSLAEACNLVSQPEAVISTENSSDEPTCDEVVETLIIENIPADVNRDELNELLASYGTVHSQLEIRRKGKLVLKVRISCDMEWIIDCLNGSVAFGTSTEPLKCYKE